MMDDDSGESTVEDEVAGATNEVHVVQLTPLPPHHVCFSKVENGLSFWYRLTWIVQEKGS